MTTIHRSLFAMAVVFLSGAIALGQINVLQYNFAGQNGTQTTGTSGTNLTGIGSSGLFERGPGLAIPTANLTDSINALNWSTSTTLTDLANDYYRFSFTTNSLLSLNSIIFDANRGGQGPQIVQLRYELNGGTAFTTAGPTIALTNASASGLTFNLASIPALQNLPSGTSLAFRIYGYDAGGSSGANNQNLGIQNTFTVTAAPEPATVFGVSALCVACAGYWRKKRNSLVV
jgi:hypothetical protein